MKPALIKQSSTVMSKDIDNSWPKSCLDQHKICNEIFQIGNYSSPPFGVFPKIHPFPEYSPLHHLLMREVRQILILVCHILADQPNATSPNNSLSRGRVITINFVFSLFPGQETKTWILKWSHRQLSFDHFKNYKINCRNKVYRKCRKCGLGGKL